jgi:diguanylate cyclase (GGDEF)-like protein
MKKHDPVNFRQSLVQLLEAHPPREDQFLTQFEKARAEGHPVYSQVLYILAHLSFSEHEAQRHWQKILSHRTWLKTELGRDPGLRVAILDYFVNVNQVLKNPKLIELSIYERTERSAVTDGLTGLFNHAYFLQALRREVQRSRRHAFQLSLILLDLDNFKKVNDSYGHLEGDKVLAKTAALLSETLREMDIAARYGGEEFAVILPDTARTGAYVVADRIRRRIEERFRRGRKTRNVTISGGVATFPADAASTEDLIQGADQSLYRSKADGKNRITLASGERRRHVRMPVSHRVTLDGEASKRKIAARTKNASEDGLLLSLKEPMPIGSNVKLLIHPQHGQSLGMRGEVVRVEARDAEHALYDVGLRLHGDRGHSLVMLDRESRA